MNICILSDSHDRIELLEAAVDDGLRHDAEAVLHCGDIVAPYTLKGLQRFNRKHSATPPNLIKKTRDTNGITVYNVVHGDHRLQHTTSLTPSNQQ